MMKYPNLVWAVEKTRMAHYEFAAQVRIERTRFSRGLHGVTEFTPAEMARISEALGYSKEWLFAEPRPPIRSAVSTAASVPAMCAGRE